MDVRFDIQDPFYPDTAYHYEAILEAAGGAKLWKGIYAFASKAGVNQLIEDTIFKDFIKEGGEIELLVGLDAVTNKPTLERLQELEAQTSAFRPRVFWNETASLFHPKLSYFEYADGRYTLVVGSGNLTPGGLESNYEGYTVISASEKDQIDITALDSFLIRHQDQIRKIDDEAIERAAKNLFRSSGGTKKKKKSKKKAAVKKYSNLQASERVLVSQVPRAGGRWAQVHFNVDVIRDFFRIRDYEKQRVFLNHVNNDGAMSDTEVRPCVYSQSNKNHKIEIGAAKGMGYPDSPPVLVFHEMKPRVFNYIILFPGDDGYDELIVLSERLPAVGRGFPRVITEIKELKNSWSKCPLFFAEESEKAM